MFKKISTQVSNLAIQTIEYRDYLVVFIIYQETMTVLYTILMQILKIIPATLTRKNIE